MKRAATAVFAALACTASGQATGPATPPACAAPEHRQFDFWVGDWTAFDTKSGALAGESRIERLYDGCTIRENWSETGLTGGSLNAYVAADRRWHQVWTDSRGSWRDFVGGLDRGRMVLVWTHPSLRFPGRTAKRRLSYTPNPDGSVRQQAAEALDGGPWVESYDITYRRRS